MSRHLSLRSGNPALNSKVFRDFSSKTEETMTLNGAVNKTALSLLILLLSGFVGFYITFNSGYLVDGQMVGMSSAYMIVGFIVGLSAAAVMLGARLLYIQRPSAAHRIANA